MFRTDNSEFTDSQCEDLNAVLGELLATSSEEDKDEHEKTYSDRLNNCWRDGMTREQLRESVRRN